MNILTDMRLLKGMAKQGLIILAGDTGKTVKHWSGQKVKAYYIASGPYRFEYKGKEYAVKYFDGCFSPFVVCLD